MEVAGKCRCVLQFGRNTSFFARKHYLETECEAVCSISVMLNRPRMPTFYLYSNLYMIEFNEPDAQVL